MEKISIKTIEFTKLKSLHDVTIQFDKPLTAIMGGNGVGKTTVIHAMACIYKPDGNGDNHRFSDFFLPNTDALWNGSLFFVKNVINGKEMPEKHYAKIVDRWNPRYEDRPKRNVYYIGIESGLPEIEKTHKKTRLLYSKIERVDKNSKKLIEIAARVLDIQYEALIENIFHSNHFLGVRARSGLTYSSLSMGTGEQRTIKILDKVLNAEAYSLILIDEIDLLLHVAALRRLLEELNTIAKDKNLQIVFTTHSLEILSLSDIIGIQYIENTLKKDGSKQTLVYNKPSSDIVRRITDISNKPIKVFVEDNLSKAIVKTIVRDLKMSVKVEIKEFGAAQNAFSLITGRYLSGITMDNTLIVLDGDVYKTDPEKMEQMKKVLTGTEKNIDKKREEALMSITQFNLPNGTTPEKFMYDLIIQNESDDEIIQTALRLQTVRDDHEYIYRLCEQLSEEVETLVAKIVPLIKDSEQWNTYIAPVKGWLEKHREV